MPRPCFALDTTDSAAGLSGWEARFAALSAERERRIAAKARMRAEFAEARAHGLAARHATKLTRLRNARLLAELDAPTGPTAATGLDAATGPTAATGLAAAAGTSAAAGSGAAAGAGSAAAETVAAAADAAPPCVAADGDHPEPHDRVDGVPEPQVLADAPPSTAPSQPPTAPVRSASKSAPRAPVRAHPAAAGSSRRRLRPVRAAPHRRDVSDWPSRPARRVGFGRLRSRRAARSPPPARCPLQSHAMAGGGAADRSTERTEGGNKAPHRGLRWRDQGLQMCGTHPVGSACP